MALHYVLDGYNVIRQSPALMAGGLESSRDRLVLWLETQRPQGSPRNQVTVVFDGRSGIVDSSSRSPIKVVFSSDETADEHIKRLVEERRKQRENLVVVTNDRAIQFAVRSAGARVMSVEDFLGNVKSHQDHPLKSSKSKGVRETKYISKTLEHKITKDLEKVWLGKTAR